MGALGLEREGDRRQSTLYFDEVYIGVSQRNVAISGESDNAKAAKQEQIEFISARPGIIRAN